MNSLPLLRLVLIVGGLGLWLERCPAAEPTPDRELPAAVDVAPQAVRDGQVVQRQPSAAFGHGVYLVAWSDGARKIDRPSADIYCARLDATTGRPLDPAGIRVCTAGDLQEWPAVAFDGKNFLVAWQDFRSGRHYDVYAARITPAGKVLDPDGFPVSAGPSNQCRPAVAAAGGNWIVVWMDARTYPLYGIYGARVSADGAVLDREGLPLDVEDEAKIAKARPPQPRAENAEKVSPGHPVAGKGGARSDPPTLQTPLSRPLQWMGEHDYWWQHLASRYLPMISAQGDRCLVAYLREYPFAQSGRPLPTALVLDGRQGHVAGPPVQLPGGAHDTLAACSTPQGWTLLLADHAHGWGLAARLAAVRLDADLHTEDAFAKPHTKEPDRMPVEDLEKTLMPEKGETLNPGKGALSFWRPAAAWDGRQVVVAADFGWRLRGQANALTYVVVVNRLAPGAGAFAQARSSVVALTERADQAVANPALASDGAGRTLLVFERDSATDRQTIQSRLLPACK